MKVLLATASQEIDNYLKDNATHYEVIGEIPYRKPLLQTVEELKPSILVLSLLLPGEEDLREIVFEAQRQSECRIILLTGNAGKQAAVNMDMFFLGVRDFISDPVQPKQLLQSIVTPTSYAEATKYMRRVPVKESTKIGNLIEHLVQKDAPPCTVEISEQALLMINGILGLLEVSPAKTLEENLFLIEQGIGEILLKKARDFYE